MMEAKEYLIIAGLIIGLVTGLAGVTGALGRLCAWIRKKVKAHHEKSIRYQLQLLCAGQGDINTKLDGMDKARISDKDDDAELHKKIAEDLAWFNRRTEELNDVVLEKLDAITADVSLSVVATGISLDGLVQLGKESDVIVNGLVGDMRKKLNNRIIEGCGTVRPKN